MNKHKADIYIIQLNTSTLRLLEVYFSLKYAVIDVIIYANKGESYVFQECN